MDEDFSIRFLEDSDTTSELQAHDYFEIGFEITGDRNYFINGRLYAIQPGDVFIINNYDIHNALEEDKETAQEMGHLFQTSLHSATLLGKDRSSAMLHEPRRRVSAQNRLE